MTPTTAIDLGDAIYAALDAGYHVHLHHANDRYHAQASRLVQSTPLRYAIGTASASDPLLALDAAIEQCESDLALYQTVTPNITSTTPVDLLSALGIALPAVSASSTPTCHPRRPIQTKA